MLGKGPIVESWGADIVCFSETSHTKKAVPALFNEFRSCGYALSVSDPVPDKFEVVDPSGSYRGLSRGVALASKFPVFSPRPSFVPELAWCSQRILYSAVQIGQLPTHWVTVYLHPNAVVGSKKYLLNCKLLFWAHQIATSIDGPCGLCGDFNAPLEDFESCRALLIAGWCDLALMAHSLFGCPLGNACKSATRHSFAVGNAALQRFLHSAEVRHHNDLDSHAVQAVCLELPSYNPVVYKWPQPQPFQELQCHPERLRVASAVACPDLHRKVGDALAHQDATEALKVWSAACEDLVICNSFTDEGNRPDGKRFRGRAADVAPVKRVLAAPRFRAGRKSDFSVKFPSVAVKVRQVQKQARRFQSLLRLLQSQFFGNDHFGQVHELWNAIVRSTGFVPNFPGWVFSVLGYPVGALPTIDVLESIKDGVFAYANRLASQQWKLKKELFSSQLELSMKSEGGKKAFRCLREQALPQVRSLRVVEELKLSPQRWLPTGKSWFHVANHFAFSVGDTLHGEDFQVRVLDKQGDSLHVDRMLSRRQAAHLTKNFVTSDPEVWAPHFLSNWSKYWNRDEEDEIVREHIPYLETLPSYHEVDFGPLTIAHWRQALKTSKVTTMRGTDHWAIPDLKILPDCLVEILLTIYNTVETGRLAWPKQLSKWLLVVLRKTETDTPDWTLLRPISVSGVLYRMWARMRTVDCMRHCKTLRAPLVAPDLSTRAIWYFLADYLDRRYAEGSRPCGVVLDIIKCFNILSRDVVYDIMIRLGFPERVLSPWFRALSAMSRSVLIDGVVYGDTPASTGVPEGDPLAVIAMFCVSFTFYRYFHVHVPQAMTCTYADNWEAVCPDPDILTLFLDKLHPFLEALRLPINPKKCWLWSLQSEHREVLRNVLWDGTDRFPVKLQARELGADIAYCLRKAARVRNERISKGHKRLVRLAGLPLSRVHKQRMLLSSVFPQALHASETALVPKSVFDRLRSKTSLSLGTAKKGANPLLACLLACPKIVDPQFVQIKNRIQLFRQVIQELPSQADLILDCLAALNGRYKGPSRLLRKELGALGWHLFGRATFRDDSGRSFHLLLSPSDYIDKLLSSSWAEFVVSKVKHRKGLEQLDTISLEFTRTCLSFTPSERGLVLTQQTGAFFTEDYRKHIPGSSVKCPKCGLPDSREHRLDHCVATNPLRNVFPALFCLWHELSPHEKYFGIFGELTGVKEFRAALGSVTFPDVPRTDQDDDRIIYTDGSCLYPRIPVLAVSSFATVRALSDGNFQVLTHGIVPGGCHSAFRGEVMGLGGAVHSIKKGTICCDCLSAVRVANDLLWMISNGCRPILPKEHLDLWTWFLEGARGCTPFGVKVIWIKGHVNWRKASGLRKVHAWFNHWADQIAGAASHWVTRLPVYQSFVQRFFRQRRLARWVHEYQSRVAFVFASTDVVEVRAPAEVTVKEGVGPFFSVSDVCLEECAVSHVGFASKLVSWLSNLKWYTGSVDREESDLSWLELFWGFIHDTLVLPPFRYGGRWVTLEDDVALSFVLPSLKVLFRTWRCCVDALVRGGMQVPWGPVPSVASVTVLGARFVCPGISGHVVLPRAALVDLSFQFARSRCLADLRIPSFF